MDPEFWNDRWRNGRIGFHQARVTPLLERHWDAVGVPAGGRVFVPLAGKSLDMAWLASRGHPVLAAELSELAVGQFFAEQGLTPEVRQSRHGTRYSAAGIEIVAGDAFALDDADLADCAGVFDRAALVAVPPALRVRYVSELYAALPAGCRGLLVTLEYPQDQKQGPPFSVPETEVRTLYEGWCIDILERRGILAEQQAFAEEGVTALDTVAYRLEHSA